MSVIGSNILAGSSGQGGAYNLSNSLRFRSSANAYLNRTFGSPTNNNKWTWSGWVKRGALGTNSALFGAWRTTQGVVQCYFNSNDTLRLYVSDNSNTTYLDYQTSAVYRDPAAWYHVVISIDNTLSTTSALIYINGTQVTAFGTSTNTLSQNAGLAWNYSGSVGYIGQNRNTADSAFGYLDGYLAEVNFIDGQALTPSSFGQTSATTGVWIPKKYTGTYGTNGFYLPFTDNSALTTSSNVGLGKDFSGNANYWTTNNISITAGTTYDSMTDVPTLTSATAANYCVLSPVDTYDNPPTEGNLRRTGVGHTGSPWSTCRATLGVSSGKWYFEGTLTGSTGSVGNNMIGVMTTTTSTLSDAYGGSTTRSYQANGNLQGDNSTGTVSSATSGDVIMIAFDVDAGKLWVGKNGTWMNSGVPASGTGNVFTTLPTSPIVPQVSMYGNTGDNYGWFTNFGQRPFAYTPPTGFVALNTFNLPTPTIGATASTLASKYFNAITYTGNGGASSNTTQNITTNFYPDLIWVKGRDSAFYHRLTSTGLTQPNYLSTNSTDAEGSVNDQISALASTYFQVKAAGSGGTNQSGLLYVGWAWNANSGSTVSNTAGSITSSVSANTSAGFSVVTYTGNGGTSDTIGHGLGVAPRMIIIKVRSNAIRNWVVYHASLGSTRKIHLNLTDADEIENGSFGGLSPTSTTFGVGYAATNGSSETFVAYCFAPVAGYSAFGSYIGNSSTNGTFVYLGFRPRFVMIKRATSADPWIIHDTARDIYNGYSVQLYPNDASAEGGSYSPPILDEVSNGFKLRSSASGTNDSASTYIYMAFAENPFKYANAR
jgi:hypothetical protein